MSEILGFINIIKPTGMTSFDVVRKVKKILGIKRVGHLGTLDPAASGVLPIAVGKATKFFDYFLNKDKIYFACAKFGILTDTLDSSGKVILQDDKTVTLQEVKDVAKEFVGKQLQVPPRFSAVKIEGRKAYELARSGEEFEIKPKQIEVFDIDVLKEIETNLFLIKMHVSAGTYVRTLNNDIAGKLGTVAITPVIIRTKSGAFNMQDGVTLEEFEKDPKVLKIEDVLSDLPIVTARDTLAKKMLNGVKVSKNEFEKTAIFDEKYRKYNEINEFLLKIDEKIAGVFKIFGENVQRIVFL